MGLFLSRIRNIKNSKTKMQVDPRPQVKFVTQDHHKTITRQTKPLQDHWKTTARPLQDHCKNNVRPTQEQRKNNARPTLEKTNARPTQDQRKTQIRPM